MYVLWAILYFFFDSALNTILKFLETFIYILHFFETL